MARARSGGSWAFAYGGLMMLLFGYYFVQSQSKSPTQKTVVVTKTEIKTPSQRMLRLKEELGEAAQALGIREIAMQGADLSFHVGDRAKIEPLSQLVQNFRVAVQIKAPFSIEKGNTEAAWASIGTTGQGFASRWMGDPSRMRMELSLDRALSAPEIQVVVSD